MKATFVVVLIVQCSVCFKSSRAEKIDSSKLTLEKYDMYYT